MKLWALNLIIAIDQLANCLLRGDPDENCKLAFEGELRRRQLPGAYRAGGEQQPLEG